MTIQELENIFVEKSTRYHRITLEEGVNSKNVVPLSEEWLGAFLDQVSSELTEPNVVDVEIEGILNLLASESGLSLNQISHLPDNFVIPPLTQARAEKLRQFTMNPTTKH